MLPSDEVRLHGATHERQSAHGAIGRHTESRQWFPRRLVTSSWRNIVDWSSSKRPKASKGGDGGSAEGASRVAAETTMHTIDTKTLILILAVHTAACNAASRTSRRTSSDTQQTSLKSDGHSPHHHALTNDSVAVTVSVDATGSMEELVQQLEKLNQTFLQISTALSTSGTDGKAESDFLLPTRKAMGILKAAIGKLRRLDDVEARGDIMRAFREATAFFESHLMQMATQADPKAKAIGGVIEDAMCIFASAIEKLADAADVEVREDIAFAIRWAMDISDSALQELSSTSSAQLIDAIVEAARGAAVTAKGLIEQVTMDTDSNLSRALVDAIGGVRVSFARFIEQLPSTEDAEVKRAIMETFREAAVFFEGCLKQMADVADPHLKKVYACAIGTAAPIFESAIEKMPSTENAKVRDTIMQMVREAVAFVQGRAQQITGEAGPSVSYYIEEAIKRVASIFISAIDQLPSAGGAKVESEIMKTVIGAATTVEGLIGQMVSGRDPNMQCVIEIAIATRGAADVFEGAIEQLSNTEDAKLRAAITETVEGTVTTVGGLIEKLSGQVDPQVRWAIERSIGCTLNIFKSAIEQLPSTDAEIRAAILETVGATVALVESRLEQMAHLEDPDMIWAFVSAIEEAVDVFKSAIEQLSGLEDAGERGAIMEMVRAAATTFGGPIEQAGSQIDDTYESWVASNPIQYGVDHFGSHTWQPSRAKSVQGRAGTMETDRGDGAFARHHLDKVVSVPDSNVREALVIVSLGAMDTFKNSIEKLSCEEDDQAIGDIMQTVEGTVTTVGDFLEQLSGQIDPQVRWAIERSIGCTLNIFKSAIEQLPSTDAEIRAAILETVGATVALVEGHLEQMAHLEDPDMIWAFVSAIEKAVDVFKSAIEQLSGLEDAGERGAIMEMVRAAATTVGGLAGQILDLTGPDMTWAIRDTITCTGDLFKSAIQQLSGGEDLRIRGAILILVEEATAFVRGRVEEMVRDTDLTVRSAIQEATLQVARIFISAIDQLPSAGGAKVESEIMKTVIGAATTVEGLIGQMVSVRDLDDPPVIALIFATRSTVEIFERAIEQLPSTEDAKLRAAITETVEGTVTTVGGLIEQLSGQKVPYLRSTVESTIGYTVDTFKSAIEQLVSTQSAKLKAAIMETVRSAAAFVKDHLEQIADLEDPDVRLAFANAIQSVVYVFKSTIEELSRTNDAKVVTVILKVANGAAAFVRDNLVKILHVTDIDVRHAIQHAISHSANMSESAIKQLPNATDRQSRDAIINEVRNAVATAIEDVERAMNEMNSY